MNEVFNEAFGTTKTEQQTPIEIALGVDAQGMTTAKKLYKFLELESAHYARWCEKNILQNRFAERDVDFWAFTTNGEWGGQTSIDYKLTASFAKKLSMVSKSPRGEAARNYFVGVENGAKQMATEYKLLDSNVAASVAKLGNTTEHIMTKQGSAPYKIAEAFKMQCEQFGIKLPDDFVKAPEYEQMGLDDFLK